MSCECILIGVLALKNCNILFHLDELSCRSQVFILLVTCRQQTHFFFSLEKWFSRAMICTYVHIQRETGTRTKLVYVSGEHYSLAASICVYFDTFQVEGAFVQGIGYFMNEEYVTNPDGLVVSDGTWTCKIPTMDPSRNSSMLSYLTVDSTRSVSSLQKVFN